MRLTIHETILFWHLRISSFLPGSFKGHGRIVAYEVWVVSFLAMV